MGNERELIAWRAAQDLPPGAIVNLGRGLPILVADQAPPGRVMSQSENGLLGVGPSPRPDKIDSSLTNASKQPVTLVAGGSVFDLAESFDMIRGGHVDLALLGAFQVSEAGDLANWATETGSDLPPAVGGAMDLAVGCREVWVLMSHCDRDGAPKVVDRCTLPLTAAGVVTRIFTEKGTFETVRDGGMRVLERDHDLAAEELQAITGARLLGIADARPLRVP